MKRLKLREMLRKSQPNVKKLRLRQKKKKKGFLSNSDFESNQLAF